jgi:ComF family protein
MAPPAAVVSAASALGALIDFALPPRCPGCGAVTGEPHRFCLDCWQSIRFLGDPCCTRCGRPFAHDRGGDAECAACIADPPDYDRLRAAVAYGEVARRVALKLKYGRRPGVAQTLAHLMRRHVEALSGRAGEAPLLAPVPLHRWRIWKRGYNQSALIATAIGKRTGHEVALDLLRRVKATPSLRGLGRRERAMAVRGAFRVLERTKPLIAGRTILLVDDVYTSGATANACARTLRRAGAAEVNIICWARVIGEDES